MTILPTSEEILQQLMINKYSGNTTVFVNDKEYRVIKRLEYGFEVEELNKIKSEEESL